MKRLHGICLAIFLLPFSVVSVAKPQISKADSSESAPLTLADILKASPTVLPDPTRLLDASVPLGERQKIFNVFEKLADNGNTYSQYVVGSLYRIGRQLPASPVQSDVNKASLYLSNAATHGRILAMAKMAEMKLREGDYLEAMNWAQIFGHYATLLPQADRPSPGYIAELIERIDEKFDRSKLPEVVKNVNIFVVNYDASVKEGVTNYTSGSNADLRQSSPTNQIYTPGTFDPKFANQAPKAGFAEFLISFKPDGSVQKIWILDSIPDPNLGIALDYVAKGAHANPVPESKDADSRYGWLPVMFDDGRYRLNK